LLYSKYATYNEEKMFYDLSYGGHYKLWMKRGQMSMHQNKRKFILPFLVSIVIAILVVMTYLKTQDITQWPTYSKEHILRNIKQPKNLPLIEELFILNDLVKDIIDQKSGSIQNPEKRADLILLTKICKDSCKAIRCRIDPGLGQACRQNCPSGKVDFCILATKRLSPENQSNAPITD